MASSEKQKIPKLKTRQSWKQEFKYLDFDKDFSMTCTVCCKHDSYLKQSCTVYSDTFVKGSTNYRKSTVSNHFNESKCTHSQWTHDLKSTLKQS